MYTALVTADPHVTSLAVGRAQLTARHNHMKQVTS